MSGILLKLCGLFYMVLCVFSVVTGIMYIRGKRELNPLELSDSFVKKLDTPDKLHRFAVKMGYVTFVVGIVQGITAFAIFKGHSLGLYAIALGFTIFSIASVSFKLKGKINSFSLMKMVFYVAILIVLLISRVSFM